MDLKTPLTIYVPVDTARLGVTPGSGIVGSEQGERVLIDFADARSPSTRTFADRVAIAHGRHVTRYPVVARLLAPAGDLAAVGTYDPVEGDVLLAGDTESALLAAWLGVDELPDQELHTTGFRHTERRRLRTALREGRIPRPVLAQHARRTGNDDLL